MKYFLEFNSGWFSAPENWFISGNTGKYLRIRREVLKSGERILMKAFESQAILRIDLEPLNSFI